VLPKSRLIVAVLPFEGMTINPGLKSVPLAASVYTVVQNWPTVLFFATAGSVKDT
jgi:hypothetical protein